MDASQLAGLHAGDESVLGMLFKQYNRRLLFFAKQMVKEQTVAEEIVSDTFVKLWDRRHAFKNVEGVKAFLYIATKNACLNHVKSAHARQVFDHDDIDQLATTDPDVFTDIIRAELLQKIHAEVMKLSEKQRDVFNLSYIEGLSTEEICDRLGMNPAAVFANRSRAIGTLRKLFAEGELWACLLLLQDLLNKN